MNFLDTAPFGADGYLSVYARMYPQISTAFWKAYTSGNMKAAIDLVEKYDIALLLISLLRMVWIFLLLFRVCTKLPAWAPVGDGIPIPA